MNPLAWWAVGAATYVILGLATVVAWMLEHGEPARGDLGELYILVVIWPYLAPYLVAVWVARKIGGRDRR